MNLWLRQHAHAIKVAASHVRADPGNFLFNVLVVAIALALPIAGLTLIDNIRPVAKQLAINPEVSVFLKTTSTRSAANAAAGPIRQSLKDLNVTASLRFTPKEKALTDMEGSSDLAELLATLGNNPLPDAYVISLNAEDAVLIPALMERLKKINDVDLVQVDSAWVNRLSAFVQILQVGLIFLALTLGIVVIVVVFNATRLQVMSHQAEIAVSRLLGATNSFIRQPYYYTGAGLGLLACALALGGIALGLGPLNTAIADFVKLYGSDFQLRPLAMLPSAILLIVSLGLGLLGAFLSAWRQLQRTR